MIVLGKRCPAKLFEVAHELLMARFSSLREDNLIYCDICADKVQLDWDAST